jgi:hypothetical protein
VKADGTGLVWCGYVGGGDVDGATGVRLDASGRAVVVGTTYSTEATFPVAGGPDLTFNGTNATSDAFVAVVRANGSKLDMASYVGGELDDLGTGVAVDPSGRITVVGATTSTALPAVGSLGGTSKGQGDGFVQQISASGAAGPTVASAVKQGKKLVVTGQSFDRGAVILVNGTAYKTKADAGRPTEVLKSGKAGKAVRPGDRVSVRDADGRVSNEVTFSG